MRWNEGRQVTTSMPKACISMRSEAAKAATACFELEYAERMGTGSLPDMEETTRMRGAATPPAAALWRSAGRKALHVRTTPR